MARLVQLMRPAEISEGPAQAQRTASEFAFKDMRYFLRVLTEIQKARRHGDDERFIRLLFEGAMRLRLLDDDQDDRDNPEKLGIM